MGSWVPIRLGGRQFPDPILHVGHDLSSTPSMRLDESSRMLFRWKWQMRRLSYPKKQVSCFVERRTYWRVLVLTKACSQELYSSLPGQASRLSVVVTDTILL